MEKKRKKRLPLFVCSVSRLASSSSQNLPFNVISSLKSSSFLLPLIPHSLSSSLLPFVKSKSKSNPLLIANLLLLWRTKPPLPPPNLVLMESSQPPPPLLPPPPPLPTMIKTPIPIHLRPLFQTPRMTLVDPTPPPIKPLLATPPELPSLISPRLMLTLPSLVPFKNRSSFSLFLSHVTVSNLFLFLFNFCFLFLCCSVFNSFSCRLLLELSWWNSYLDFVSVRVFFYKEF